MPSAQPAYTVLTSGLLCRHRPDRRGRAAWWRLLAAASLAVGCSEHADRDGLEELQITRTKERGLASLLCRPLFPFLGQSAVQVLCLGHRAAASHAHWLLPSGAPWASCAAAARRMRGRRSTRRRLSRRTQQLRRTPGSNAAPRRRRRVLRSSSRRSGCTNPAPSQIDERPHRVAAVFVARPPRSATRRSTAYSATRRPAATAPSSRCRALLTRDAMQCRGRDVRAGFASRPPAHRACLRRRAARADGQLLYMRRTRTILGRAVRTAYRGTPGGDRLVTTPTLTFSVTTQVAIAVVNTSNRLARGRMSEDKVDRRHT